MVSGRPADSYAHCSQCGGECSIYAYENRSELLCPKCKADNEPAQMSLLTRSQEKALKGDDKGIDWIDQILAPPSFFYRRCEGCLNPECKAGPKGCNCCKWIGNSEFYWGALGECCQPKFAPIMRSWKQYINKWGWDEPPKRDEDADLGAPVVAEPAIESTQLNLFGAVT